MVKMFRRIARIAVKSTSGICKADSFGSACGDDARKGCLAFVFVMAGLGPAIHDGSAASLVDARAKRGHDDRVTVPR
jgi:hypothetical protein